MNPESQFQVAVIPLPNHPGTYTYAVTRTDDRKWEVAIERYPTAGEAAVAGAGALEHRLKRSSMASIN